MSKTTSVLKWGPKKGRQEGGKNWLHSPEALSNGSVIYAVKFLGVTDVNQPKGTEVVKEAIKKLKFANHIKRSEAGVKGSKLRKVEIVISIDYLKVQDAKTKEILYTYPLHRISYCADDKSDKKLFAFIAKDKGNPNNACFVFESEKLAEELTLTVGQAFQLAYNRFLENQKNQTQNQQSETTEQLSTMQKQIQEAEAEKEALKQKISQLESQAFPQQQQPQQQAQQTAQVQPAVVKIAPPQPVATQRAATQPAVVQPAAAQPAVPQPAVPQRNGNASNLLDFGVSFETDQDWSSKTVEDIFDPLTGLSQAPAAQAPAQQNPNMQFHQAAPNQFQNQAGFGAQPQTGFQQAGFGNAPFDPFSNMGSSGMPAQAQQQQITGNPFATNAFAAPAPTQQVFMPAQQQPTAVARPTGTAVGGGMNALPPPPGRQRPRGAQPAAQPAAQPFMGAAAPQAPVQTPFEDSFMQMSLQQQQPSMANDLADLQEGFAKGLQMDNISCSSFDLLDG